MKQTPIGLIIKEIAAEKNIKVSTLAQLSGKSRQTVYFTFGRTDMTDQEIAEWAVVLGTSKDILFDRWKNNTKEEGLSHDSNYLMEHLTNLEEQFKRLLNQLDVKDRQIEKLMDLLGKPEDVMQLAATRVIALYPEVGAQA
jgi:hypothetical protein